MWSLIISKKLAYFSDLIGSVSLEAFDGRSECFDELIHIIRPHKGQLKSAKNIRNFLKDSEIQNSDKLHVQDPILLDVCLKFMVQLLMQLNM